MVVCSRADFESVAGELLSEAWRMGSRFVLVLLLLIVAFTVEVVTELAVGAVVVVVAVDGTGGGIFEAMTVATGCRIG